MRSVRLIAAIAAWQRCSDDRLAAQVMDRPWDVCSNHKHCELAAGAQAATRRPAQLTEMWRRLAPKEHIVGVSAKVWVGLPEVISKVTRHGSLRSTTVIEPCIA